MAGNSVFYKLVRKENAHTQLLCNLMLRNDEFRNRVLRLFLSEKSASGIKPSHIHTQFILPECGCPDIVIQSPEVCAVVEVKTDWWRPLTPHQLPTLSRGTQVKTYGDFLSRCDARERFLVYLVPRDWKYRERVRKFDGTAKAANITCEIRDWEEIVPITTALAEDDPFLKEFRKLLDRFAPITFSKKEAGVIFKKGFPIGEVLKLQKVVEQVGKKAQRKKYKVDFYTTQEESGFSLVRGDEWFFWCGIWVDAWQQEGLLLSFGIYNPSIERMPDLRNAFSRAYKGAKREVGDYTLGWIPQETLEEGDAVKKVWGQLEPILDEVHEAASRKAVRR